MGLPNTVTPLLNGGTPFYLISDSVRFRSAATAYFNRTPSVAGNRRTWTWSGWVKRGTLSSAQWIFDAFQDASNFTAFFFNSNDTFGIQYFLAATSKVLKYTTQVFRDPAAWYHLVVAIDTTPATPTFNVYVNGVQVTAFGTNTNTVSQNEQLFVNNTIAHNIGRYGGAANYFDGYIAELNFIDGQSLTPSSFGAFDNNGIWQPKKYTGSYGTNGFWLPFYSGYNTTASYAGSFNGTNQFLNVASSASLAPGTGDFTIEANINLSALPGTNGYAGIFENQIATTSATSDKFLFAVQDVSGTKRLSVVQHGTGNTAYVNWTPTVGTWYHVAAVRQSGIILLFINGVQQTVTNNTNLNGVNLGQNGASIGAISTPFYFNGYISNARYVVGTAVYTTGFTPPSSNLTAVTNTQWLTLQNATIIDNSSAARTITNNNSVIVSNQYPFQYTIASLGADYSGNGNNWTTNNISTSPGTTYDIMLDSPTVSNVASNYCVFNPLYAAGGTTFSNGNLQATTGTSTAGRTITTMGVSTGKWYWEITPTSIPANVVSIGVVPNPTTNDSGTVGNNASEYGYLSNGQKFSGGSATAYGASYVANDVIGVALDCDGGTITFYKNNVSQGTAFSITAATTYIPAVSDSSATDTATFVANFGQRPFLYTPPSGYLALNTANLPSSPIGNGAQYMAATTYTGNGSTLSVTNGGNNNIGATFQPDFVWMKSRSAATDHALYDSVRGATFDIASNLTAAQTTQSTGLTSFDSNGFTVGSLAKINTNAATYVAWQWKAGQGTTSTNTSGSITSTVSVNAQSGFSIVSYTGTGAAATIGHGLGVAPQMILVKKTSAIDNWGVYHVGNPSPAASYALTLNTTSSAGLNTTYWNATAPTSSVFSVGTAAQTNTSGASYIAYCFSAVQGYSAFGSYTANGNANGPYIYTGFRARWLLLKRQSGAAESWILIDTSRDTYNLSQNDIYPNLTNAETVATIGDILSNGFKLRSTTTGGNTSTSPYVYAAFAENPFNFSRAR